MELPAQLEVASAWREIQLRLREASGDWTFDIWLAPLGVRDWNGDVLSLQAPPGTQAWVSKRYGALIRDCVRSVLGDTARVSLEDEETRGPSAPPEAPSLETGPPGGLNPRFSFEQFIIGDGNRLAHAGALAVSELPGQAYNPLFLYAPPGLGKTHLLHAIGNYVLQFGGGAAVRYTTVEGFTNHFINAIATRAVDRFKQTYRSADVLLIDDVQFLASKVKTEEEFFHTFNALYENGRQLVLTCDRLPRQLDGVEERLRERFEAGLVAQIAPPDFATRVTILRKRARLDQITMAGEDVLEMIAERVTDNVRALEGTLIRIVAHHSLTGQPLDIHLARAVLDDMHPVASPGAQLTIVQIQEAVANHYDIAVTDLLAASRAARLAWPRQMAIHLARELTGSSLQQIGEAFGGRNHATIVHACKRVSARIERDGEAAHDLRLLAAQLSGRVDRQS